MYGILVEVTDLAALFVTVSTVHTQNTELSRTPKWLVGYSKARRFHW